MVAVCVISLITLSYADYIIRLLLMFWCLDKINVKTIASVCKLY